MARDIEKDIADTIKRLTTKEPGPRAFDPEDLLSCGSSVLNAACSNHSTGAFPTGCFVLFVGDSESGKTWIAANTLAEAANNPRFDKYDLYFDDPEGGMLMDTVHYFGSKLTDRLKAPKYDKKTKEPIYSVTIEDFKANLERLFEVGRPFIYVEDSLDALSCLEDLELAKAQRKAIEAGKPPPASYGTSKAKLLGATIRENMHRIRKLDSIVIMLAQAKQTIGFGAQFNPKTRAGGTAPKFFANIELWTSVEKQIYAEYKKGKKIQKGMVAQVKIKKNRITGKHRTVSVPIYQDFGIDDIGSSIDFMVGWGHWPKKAGVIQAEEFDKECRKSELIAHIEEEGLEKRLQKLVGKVWRRIEKKVTVKRKPRYE